MRLPTLTGEFRTAGDPELRFTAAGKAVANVTLIATESKRTEDGQGWEDGDRTPFITATVWGPAAEDVAGTITKGERVLASGALFQRTYERNDGTEGVSIELKWATVAPIPGGKPKGQGGGGSGVAYGGQQQRRPQGQQQADPWAQQPQGDPWATPGGKADEPPF